MQQPDHILIVDDDQDIRELLEAYLRRHGFKVTAVANGRRMNAAVESNAIDLIVLDLMLQGEDGLTLCRDLRVLGKAKAIPILMLTARNEEADRVIGLEMGADDYITKPFNLEEVLARIRAVLKRSMQAAGRRLQVADLELDEDLHEVRRGGEAVALTPTEFRLLRFLMVNAGRVVSRGQILDHVWEYNPAGEGNVVDPCISYLRRKVDQREPRLIHTIRGAGYMIRIPPP
jgi:two-component system, OmpR family, response regulator